MGDQHDEVGRNPVAGLELHHVVGHEGGRVDDNDPTVATDPDALG